MPASLVLLALVAVAVPSAARAVVGRPRMLLAATLASGVASVAAQVVGELTRTGLGVVGDAQVGAAVVGSALASAVVALVEGPHNRRTT